MYGDALLTLTLLLTLALTPTLTRTLSLTLTLTLNLTLTLTRYGDGASDAAGVGGMIAYLRKHNMTEKLNAAVNEVAKGKPDDPMAALIALLQKA